ncbi:hypothetical protein J3Q64DRAFT_1750877 [Phycomyces blakesleeanus]|uniref:Peptidase S54 rhomboid domain-containing protein n=1 Tax=Phycomyces blakesleeanus TaxID=4837 RepID=A0ABR3AW07_PHYBL
MLQVHRLAVYPLASPGLSLVIANLLLSITYMAELEKRKGSLKTLWILICFLTVIPGIGYVFFVSVFAYMVKMADGELQHTLCAGLSGLAVGLSVWSTLEDQDEEEVQYRMLFGVIRIPRRLVPVLTIAFYFFLAPDTSLILHICAAGSGYLYASKQLPAFLLPSDETFQRQEQEGWFHRLTNRRGFVSVDDIGPYLPISTTNTEPIHSVPGVSTPFQGQGTRLGD